METVAEGLRAAAIAILLALHLICVNIAALGPLACIGLAGTDRVRSEIGRWLAWLCCGLFFGGMLLGGLVIGIYDFNNQDAFFKALLRIPHSRLHWASAELLFYLACLVPVAIWWRGLCRMRMLLGLLVLLAASNLIYHFIPLFVIISALHATAGEGGELTACELLQQFGSLPVLARVVHHLIAGVAVVALTVALRSAHAASRAESPEAEADLQRLTQTSGRWALTASLLEIPSGLWFLWQIPEAAREAMLGGAMLPTALFVAALLLVFLLLQKLLAVAMGETDGRSVTVAAGLLLATIVLMSGLLQQLGTLRAV
jgi:hypothetical protein